MEIQLYQLCSACNGTGVRRYNPTPNAPLVEENPCVECGGDGRAPASFTLESEWFDDVTDKLNDIKEKVDEIKESLEE